MIYGTTVEIEKHRIDAHSTDFMLAWQVRKQQTKSPYLYSSIFSRSVFNEWSTCTKVIFFSVWNCYVGYFCVCTCTRVKNSYLLCRFKNVECALRSSLVSLMWVLCVINEIWKKMSDNIKVVVKVRPLISREIEEKLSYQWRVKSNTLYQLDQNEREVGARYTFGKWNL